MFWQLYLIGILLQQWCWKFNLIDILVNQLRSQFYLIGIFLNNCHGNFLYLTGFEISCPDNQVFPFNKNYYVAGRLIANAAIRIYYVHGCMRVLSLEVAKRNDSWGYLSIGFFGPIPSWGSLLIRNNPTTYPWGGLIN